MVDSHVTCHPMSHVWKTERRRAFSISSQEWQKALAVRREAQILVRSYQGRVSQRICIVIYIIRYMYIIMKITIIVITIIIIVIITIIIIYIYTYIYICLFIYLYLAPKKTMPTSWGNLEISGIVASLNHWTTMAGDTFPASFCGSLFYCTSAKAWHAKQSSWKAGLGVRSTPQTII